MFFPRENKYRVSRKTFVLLICIGLFSLYIILANVVSDNQPVDLSLKPLERDLDACTKNHLSVETVLKHTTCEFGEGGYDLWLVIHNKVYDVSDWIMRHPGGGAICSGAATDSSKAFDMFHDPGVTSHYLPQYCVGYLNEDEKMPQPRLYDDDGNEIIH